MIVVRIEVWPHGDSSKARELDQVFIVNDGTGTKDLGNYSVFIGGRQLRERKRNRKKHFRDAKRIISHPRRLGVISLVERAFAGITLTNQYKDRHNTNA